MEIGLFLSDNQFIEGVLLDIKQDHIVVDVNQNIYYFALQHIQALSQNAKDFRISSEVVHYVDRNNLIDVLESLRYNWVSINSLGDQVLCGVLSKISDDYITVINNSELLYIPKSYLSTISSNISEEQIILLNKQEQHAIKGGQIEDEITSEHTQKIKEIERVTNREVPVIGIPLREGIEDENVTNEQSESHQKTKVEMYAILVKLLKHNLLNRDVDNERREDNFRETAIRGVVLHIDDKSMGQTDSEVTSQNVPSEVPELTRLVKHDLPNRISEYTLEENHRGVVESNNQDSQEDQLLPTKSRVKGKEKRLLISAWSTMNNDQHAIVNHENIAMENEAPNCKGDPKKKEQPTDLVNSLFQPLHDQYLNEDFVTLEENSKSAETTIFQLPVIRINQKEKKEMLEKQYYALMKQAETNCFHMSERQLHLSEEEQYFALMKHAAKMYREFKD